MSSQAKQPEQWREVLAVLREGQITPLQAWVTLGILRVADPIAKLRERGYIIRTEMRPFVTTRGKHIKFAIYTLISEPQSHTREFDRSAREAHALANFEAMR